LLGVSGAETQVGDYVHQLEVGSLSPRRVRPAVVDALATIFSVPRAVLDQGRYLEIQAEPSASLAFARMAAGPDHTERLFADEPARSARVDDLFTGGPGG
jgi:hypothetical protein